MDYPTYDPTSAVTPLTQEELADLDELFAHLPSDGAMTLDGMDGYLTALLVGPVPLSAMKTGDWLPAIWGGDQEPAPAPFVSNQKRKRTTVLALRHLRAVQEALAGPPDAWEPIFSVAEVPGTHGDELADATDWCLGFLAATDLAPEAWAPLQSDPEVGPGLATIAMLAGEIEPGDDADEDAADLDDPHVRDHLSRAAADVVLQLWARKTA
ncbi:MAG: UPF0149 family protein [Burkholderiaceae bacterium]|jgi:uncharacterized protein|nr:UPF0149 family protein [Burkholderiales bacterium]